MWYVNNIINGIKKRKIIAILIIIQIIASFFLLVFLTSEIKNILFICNDKNWLIDIKNLYEVQVESSNSDFKYIYNELKKENIIDIVAIYDKQLSQKDNYNENTLLIDKEMYKLLSKTIMSGEEFDETDFKTLSNKNVLIGSSYTNNFKIGSTVTFLDENNYKIKGVIPKDKLFINSIDNNQYLDMNKFIIIPVDKEFINLNNIVVKFKENIDIPQSIKLSNGMIVNFINIKDRIIGEVKYLTDEEEDFIMMALIGVIFCIIGITISTILSIWLRQREIGIRYAIGESKFSVFLGMTIENTLICLCGVICSIAYYIYWYKDLIISSQQDYSFDLTFQKIDFTLLFSIFIMLLIVIIISSLLTFFFTRKLEPKELIGGIH